MIRLPENTSHNRTSSSVGILFSETAGTALTRRMNNNRHSMTASRIAANCSAEAAGT